MKSKTKTSAPSKVSEPTRLDCKKHTPPESKAGASAGTNLPDLTRLVATLSTRLLSATAANLDTELKSALAELGRTVKVDSSYLHLFSDDSKSIRKAFFWGDGSKLQSALTEDKLLTDLPISQDGLRWHEATDDVPAGLTSDVQKERDWLQESSGVNCLINIPLVEGERAIGAIGLASSARNLNLSVDSVASLRILGHVLAHAVARVRKETDFEVSKESFLRLVAHLDETMYRMSLPSGEYEFVGVTAAHVFGYSAQEFLDNPFLIKQILHPDCRGFFKEQWAGLVKGQAPPTYDYQVIDPEGRTRSILQSNNVIFDDQGRPIALEGICRNVTEQKMAVSSLRASEERFRAITENATDIIAVVDASAVITYLSSSGSKVLGYAIDESVGRPIWDFINEDDLNSVEAALEQSMVQPGVSVRIPDARVCHRDGTWLWMEGLVINLMDEAAVGGLIVTCRDISERKRIESQLRQAHDQLETRIAERTVELAETNEKLRVEQASLKDRTVALQEVLAQIEAGRNELAAQTQANVNKIALPILDLLEQQSGANDDHHIRLLRSCLKDITGPMAYRLEREFPELTRREQEICRMVKDGFCCKEIAALLHTSDQTVLKQRKIIRRKLGLSNKKINLASYLRSLD